MHFSSTPALLTFLSFATLAFAAHRGTPVGSSAPPLETACAGPSKAVHSGKIVGGYFPTYNADQFPFDKVNLSLYTELYFFVATTQNNFTVGLGGLSQSNWDSLAKEFVNKTKAAGVKPYLSIGGWTGSIYFSDLVATPENRTAYASSVAKFVEKYGFEGIDIDWEYPSDQGIGCNIVSANDTENWTSFMEELRTLLPNQTFTAAVSIGGIHTGNDSVLATNLTRLANVLDYLHLMTYDVYGPWTPTTGPDGPLFDTCADAADALSIKSSLTQYTSVGFKASQLVVGIPGYGRSYTLLNSTLVPKVVGNHTSYFYQQKNSTVPEGGSTDDVPGVDACGKMQSWGGIWLVSELVKKGWLSEDESTGLNGFTRYFDKCSGTPFLFNNQTLLFIAYDDTQSSTLKAEYAKCQGAAGIFFFDTTGPLDSTVASSKAALYSQSNHHCTAF